MPNDTQLLQRRTGDLKGPSQLDALNEIDANFDNIRAAWHHAVKQKNFAVVDAMIDGLFSFTHLRARFTEGEELFELARQTLAPGPHEPPHPVWGRLLSRYATVGTTSPEKRLLQALDIARATPNRAEEAHCLFELGQDKKWRQREFEAALQLYQQALAVYQDLNDPAGISSTLGEIGGVYAQFGQAAEFERYIQQALAIRQVMGDRIGTAILLLSLAELALATGDLGRAETLGQESLSIFRVFGNQWGLYEGIAVLTVSFPAILRGDETLAEIEQLIDEAQALAQTYQHPVGMARTLMLQGYLAARLEDYARALQLGDMGQATAPQDRFQWTLGSALRAYSHAGLGHYQECAQCIHTALQGALFFKVERVMQAFLPIAALYVAYQQKQFQRAAEVYALAFSQADDVTQAQQRWPLYVKLRQDLQVELSPEAYNAAWKHGKSLAVEEVVQELLTEFGQSSEPR